MTAPDSTAGELYCPTCEKTYHFGERCTDDGANLVRLSGRIDPFLGRELDGRYTILEQIGRGGMGAVYRAAQHSVGREVAIKLISSHLILDSDAIKRFLREAKLASRLSHPNAVAVLDFGQTSDGVFYLVMELVVGDTLELLCASETVISPSRLVRIGAQICDALEGAHALDIVHRDLKPSNIMLLSAGRDLVKVLDFGLAKSVAPGQGSTMTMSGAILGTPAFMAPEIALGEAYDGRADLYSLGCVLYQLGAGRPPFISTSPHELIAAHGTEAPPRMTGVPEALAAVIDRLLAKDPAQRYQTAAAARDALEATLDARTAPSGDAHAVFVAAEATPYTTIVRPRARRRWLTVVLASVASCGIAIAAIAVASSRGAPDAPPAAPAPTPATTATTATMATTAPTAPPSAPSNEQTATAPPATTPAAIGSAATPPHVTRHHPKPRTASGSGAKTGSASTTAMPF